MNFKAHSAVLRRLLRASLNSYNAEFRTLPGASDAVEHMRHVIREDVARQRRKARKAKREAQIQEAAPDAAA